MKPFRTKFPDKNLIWCYLPKFVIVTLYLGL
jgi:hypothetical protein